MSEIIKINTSPTKKQKATMIERAIRLTYDSLSSHLQNTHELSTTGKKYKKEVGNEEFHKRCVRDYSETIFILSCLYDNKKEKEDGKK